MKPDEKYMSEVYLKEEDNNNSFKFIPPSFNRSFLINDTNDEDTNNFLDLFPSETNNSELFCYYSSFSDCDDKNMKAIKNSKRPSTFDVLRNFDLDLDETTDLVRNNGDTDVDSIFTEIKTKHPGIYDSLSEYNIPEPISNIFIKRLIKLSLLYSKKAGD